MSIEDEIFKVPGIDCIFGSDDELKKKKQQLKKLRTLKKNAEEQFDKAIDTIREDISYDRRRSPGRRLIRNIIYSTAGLIVLYSGLSLYSGNRMLFVSSGNDRVHHPVQGIDSLASVKAQENIHTKFRQHINDNAKQYRNDAEFYYFPLRGDTLSKIASMVNGDMSRWRRIQAYNNLTSDLIEVNQPLKIPAEIVRDTRRLYHGRLDCDTYKAKRGETLETISMRLFGDYSHTDDIFEFNRKFNPYFSTKIWNREFVLIPES